MVQSQLTLVAKQILKSIGGEINIARFDDAGSGFIKPISIDTAKVLLDYIQSLEESVERSANALVESDRAMNDMIQRISSITSAIVELQSLPRDMPSSVQLLTIKDKLSKII